MKKPKNLSHCLGPEGTGAILTHGLGRLWFSSRLPNGHLLQPPLGREHDAGKDQNVFCSDDAAT